MQQDSLSTSPTSQQQPLNAALSSSGGNTSQPDVVTQPLPSSQRAPVVTRKVESKGKNAFVSGLNKNVTDNDLAKMFEPFGKVQQTYILTEVNTGASRGLGFVHFDDPQCVLDAISNMDGKQVTHTGKPEDATTINVRVAFDDALFSPEETNKLFIRNVPPNVRTSELAQHFSRYGKVLECSIHKDISAKGRAEGTAMHMAYVTFQSIPEANAALQAVHKTMPFENPTNKPLFIKRAESLACRNIRLRKGVPNQPANPGAMPTMMAQPQFVATPAGMPGMATADASVTSNNSSWGSSAFGQTVGSVYGNSSSAGMLAPNMYPQMAIPQPLMMPQQPGQTMLLAPGAAGAGGAPVLSAPAGGQQPMLMLPNQAPGMMPTGGAPAMIPTAVPGAQQPTMMLPPQGLHQGNGMMYMMQGANAGGVPQQ